MAVNETEYFDRLTAGEVLIELAGETVALCPTLKAAQVVSTRWGGMSKPWDEVLEFNLDTCVFLVAAGLGRKPNDELAAQVFATGLIALKNPLLAFVGMLSNGGKPLAQATKNAPAKAAPGNAPGGEQSP
jgi:hypothetical protein